MSQPPRPDSWQEPGGWQHQSWSDQSQPAPGQPGLPPQQGNPQQDWAAGSDGQGWAPAGQPNYPTHGGYPGTPPPAGGYQPQAGTYQPPVGTHPAPTARQFRPVHNLGIWALALAAIYAGLTAIASLFSPAAAAEYKWALDVGRLADTFTLYDGVGAVGELFLVPAAILGVVWLWRARNNTLVFNPQAHHQRGDVWVILGWVVPIVAFWFPYQVVRDVVRNSVRKPLGMMLGVWWAAWLVSMVVGNVASQQVDTVFGTPTSAGLTLLPFLAILAAIGTIVAAVFWARIILAVSRDQHARAAQSTGPAAW